MMKEREYNKHAWLNSNLFFQAISSKVRIAWVLNYKLETKFTFGVIYLGNKHLKFCALPI